MTDEQRKLRSVRNMIDVLRFFGEDKSVAYGYAYTFLFVLDIAESYLSSAVELLEDEKPELYRHELKKTHQHHREIIRLYSRHGP